MPSREQMATVIEHIKDVIGKRYYHEIYLEQDGHPEFDVVSPSAEIDDSETFDTLPTRAKIEPLNRDVDWEGFTEAQKDGVIRRVLDGQEAEFWMDGIAPDAPTEERPAESMPHGEFSREERDHPSPGQIANSQDVPEPPRSGPEPPRPSLPDFRADVFDALMTRLEAFGDLVADVQKSIAYISEATHQHGPAEAANPEPLTSPGEPAESVEYRSPPESIALARELMRDIRTALTKDANGNFPPEFARMDWDGLNMWTIETAWQDMDMWERYDVVVHALDEGIWSLERGDRHKLALEFIHQDARQAMPGSRADAFDALTTRLEAFGKEQAAFAERFGEFVGDAYAAIARLAEARASAGRDGNSAPERPPSPGEIAEDRGGPEPPGPERGRERGR
jgi:hypothetical protein